MTRARLTVAGVVVALLAAAVLIVFAVDVLRWNRSLAAQDVRFLGAPKGAEFSQPEALLPFHLAERSLAGRDDLVFRQQLREFVRARPAVVLDTQAVERLRGASQIALSRLSRSDPDPRRRSRAANMIGVLALDPEFAPRDPEEVAGVISGAIASFRNAVEIDPSHADAKRNLELALRIPRGAVVSGPQPTGGRNAGDVAGRGRPGGGY
jgi:hypothetical protein